MRLLSAHNTRIFGYLRNYHPLLTVANGFVLFDGGLHVRGVCDVPQWHSLTRIWTGSDALSSLYPSVRPEDVPFAEDFLGDQFLLRDGAVVRLSGETGETEEIGVDLDRYLDSVVDDPERVLSLNLLRQFQKEGGTLVPGNLLSVYPPLCTSESIHGVSLRPIPALERIGFLADFARRIAGHPEGTRIRMKVHNT
jgi:hypothetical protein